MLKQPFDGESLSLLFEKNTISRSDGSSGHAGPLSLPDPIEGAPAPKSFRRPPESSQTRSVLVPFRSLDIRPSAPSEKTPEAATPELPPHLRARTPEQPASKPTPTHTVAHLNRMLEISPTVEAAPEREESPEPGRLRRTQLRLQVLQQLLRLGTPLNERLEAVARLSAEHFSLWQVRLCVPAGPRPDTPALDVINSRRKVSVASPSELQTVLNTQKERRQQGSECHRLLLPLLHRNEVQGVLELAHSPAHSLSAEDSLSLHSLAEEVAFFLAEDQRQRQVQALSAQDTLTGLLNHRALQESLEQVLTSTPQWPVSLILLDLDFFRQINEVHGHLQGDQILQQLAQVLVAQAGKQAQVARFGSDTFAVLLPRQAAAPARQLADRLRQAVASEKIKGNFDSSLGITVSVGVTTLDKKTDKPRQVLLDQACQALTRAKEKGRNQVQSWQAPAVAPVAAPAAPARAQARAAYPELPSQPTAGVTAKVPSKPAAKIEARKWSDIVSDELENLGNEWQRQTEDYGVPEVTEAVRQLSSRLPRLLESLSQLLERTQTVEALRELPLSYFMPSPVVAGLRKGAPQYQVISYEVAFMLLQESLQAILGPHSESLQPGLENFFLSINDKLTQLKNELQGR
ncbi:MAG: GGDEF domain-containing protein [Candidatus Sericytochromatia bacterium]